MNELTSPHLAAGTSFRSCLTRLLLLLLCSLIDILIQCPYGGVLVRRMRSLVRYYFFLLKTFIKLSRPSYCNWSALHAVLVCAHLCLCSVCPSV